MSKLVCIDSGNMMYTSIHVYRRAPMCPPTYTYMKMMIGYLKKIGITLEDRVIICQDYGSWRKKVDPVYKAQRKEAREKLEKKKFWDDMYQMFNDFIAKISPSMPWHFIRVYDCEADDIASVSCRYFNDYDEKVLISIDRDWEMLCGVDKVKIFNPRTKMFKIVKNPNAILLEKIQGDKSDNLLTAPKNEEEYKKRKQIVNLLELPKFVEDPIKAELAKCVQKGFNFNKIPFRSLAIELEKLYEEI